MEITSVIEIIEAEIARLKQAKAVLTSTGEIKTGRAQASSMMGKRSSGRTGKRRLSPEAVERIREAQRRRWAKARKGQ